MNKVDLSMELGGGKHDYNVPYVLTIHPTDVEIFPAENSLDK